MSEWEIVAVSDITTLIKRGRAPHYTDVGTIVVSQKCVRDGNIFDPSLARRTDVSVKPVPDWAFLREGDVLVNSTGHGTLGRACLVRALAEPTTADSHVSIVRADETRVLSTYLGTVLSHARGELEALGSGSTTQTELSPNALGSFSILLPSLPEQRRIVDVVETVDAQVEALTVETAQARAYLEATVTETLANLEATVPVGGIATARSGPSWAAKDESNVPVQGALRVVKITNTPPDGSMTMSNLAYVTGLPRSTPLLDEASIVLIRTNGNRIRIGNAYLPTEDAIGCAVSAFQFLVKVTDPENRDYLYWALREQGMQRKMSDAASGTTGLGNLAAGWLKTAEIPWSPDPSIRAAAVERCRAVAAVVDALGDELAALRELRTSLLTGLLSPSIVIPETYDEFREGAS